MVVDFRGEEPERRAPVTRASVFRPGSNCWRVVEADKVSVIIDADAYFRAAHDAWLAARERVLLIGWDFDSRIAFPTPEQRRHLSRFLRDTVRERPGLEVRILDWNLGALKMLGRGRMALSLLRLLSRRRIQLELDAAHPVGASHHQKIVVIDDRLAFCGGIDMTSERWDTSAHRDVEPGRRNPDGSSYEPWHDTTLALSGEAARALGELARARWRNATGDTLEPCADADEIWPESLDVTFRHVPVAIARTRASYDGVEEVRESEALFVDMIRGARRFLYAESQYFAARAIGDAIVARLAEPDPPELVLVIPESAEGWLESVVMDTARAALWRRISSHDEKGRFRVYTPVTEGGAPIYVHSKIMIVDDEVLRIGSSNLNNRSLELDTECDVAIDAALCPGDDVRDAIRGVRTRLLAEHLGRSVAAIEEAHEREGSLIAVIEALRGRGRTLVPFVPRETSALERGVAEVGVHEPDEEDPPLEAFSPARRRSPKWRSFWRGR